MDSLLNIDAVAEVNPHRIKSMLFLIHLGIGDHITMMPAIQKIAPRVDTLYMFCIEKYTSTISGLYSMFPNVVLVPISIKMDISPVILNAYIFKLLESVDRFKNIPVLGCGNYSPYSIPGSEFPTLFYDEIGLNIADCIQTFQRPKGSSHLRDIICGFGIPYIFVHEVASNKTLALSEPFLKDRSRIVLTPDRNMYDPSDPFYEIAELAVFRNVGSMLSYAPLLESAEEIHCIDSCYFCMALYIADVSAVKRRVVYKRGPVQFFKPCSWEEHTLG